jgi:hypothetical protein
MKIDRIEQLERPAATGARPFRQRYVLRRRHVAEAPAIARHAARGLRAEVATAFRAVAHGIEPIPAQAQAGTFYRSGGHAWARSLGIGETLVSRGSVAAAFREMAHGVSMDAAGAAALRFYRSSGHGWTRDLSVAG